MTKDEAIAAFTKWVEERGGYDIKIDWVQEYPTEFRISAIYTLQRGVWKQAIYAVYTVERSGVVKHQYTAKFCETNGKKTINWV